MRDFGKWQTAVVTGATRGIGRAIASALARDGFRVVVTSRDLASASQVADEISWESPFSERPIARRLELADAASVQQLGAELADDVNLRVVVNNAGLALRTAEWTADGVEMHMAVNTLGHLLLDEIVLPRLCASAEVAPSGLFGITSLSTVLSSRRRVLATLDADRAERNGRGLLNAGLLKYAASKAALHQVLRHYHAHLTPRYGNLVVGSVYPGFVGTDIYREYGPLTERLVRRIAAPPEATATLISEWSLDPDAGFFQGVQRPTVEPPFVRSAKAARETYLAACARIGRKPVTERL